MPPVPPDQCSPYRTTPVAKHDNKPAETTKVGDRASGDDGNDDGTGDKAKVKAKQLKAQQLKTEQEAKLAARRSNLLKSGLPVFYRFDDLAAAGLAQNRTSLGRLIDEQGFPPGSLIGGNTRVWRVSDIEAWLATRSTARKVLPPKAGNPRAKKRRTPAEVPERT